MLAKFYPSGVLVSGDRPATLHVEDWGMPAILSRTVRGGGSEHGAAALDSILDGLYPPVRLGPDFPNLRPHIIRN